MKCGLCSIDMDKYDTCKVCDTRFCGDCGDFERALCNDCIEFEGASDGDLDDLNG